MAEYEGEVIYALRGDDSYLDSDLDSANRKVEKSAKEAGNKTEKIEEQTSKTLKEEKAEVAAYHKKMNDEIVKDDQASGKEREEAEASISGKLKSMIQDAADQSPVLGSLSNLTSGLTTTKAALLGLGAAGVMAGSKAVAGADEMRQAMNTYLAATGKSTDETERYQAVLEAVYNNNYGENFSDIADAMAQVDKQLGEMSDEELQDVTESAFALRDAFEYDVQESTRAAKAMVDNFGISGQDAMNLIVAGAQNGLDYSGELLDSISEYSVQFAKVGFDANDMFQIFQKGAETGAWKLDTMGDAIKEFAIRAIDGSETTKTGFQTIGLDADKMAAKFAQGGDVAKEAFQETIKALADLEDPMEQNAAGVALFGTMWEDLGSEVVTQLAAIQDEAYATGEEMDALKDVQYDDLANSIETLKRNFETLLIPLGEALIPLLQILAESVLPILTGILGPVIQLFTDLLTPILQVIGEAIEPLMEIINLLIDTAFVPLMAAVELVGGIFSGVLSGVFKTVSSLIGNIKNIFQGIIDFLKNIFIGNWQGAWEAVKSIFSNIVEGFGTIFKAPLNWIIDGINGFIGGLNKIKIPDWVPGVGGAGFNIALIPRLKTGLDFVPSDYFPAYLDYGERVLTQQENSIYTSLGGLQGMAESMRTADAGAKVYHIHTHVDLNGREVARGISEFAGEQMEWEEL